MTIEASKFAFGARLAALRTAAGLTQEQLGKGMAPDGGDLGKGAVSAWEVGRTTPSAAQIPKLCEILGCSPADLFSERREAV